MTERPAKSDPAASAISKAESMLAQLSGAKSTEPGVLTRAGSKVPPIKNWKVPIGVIAFLFGAQALIAALVDDQTVGSIFAVGAVVVAVLTAIVAALSYAQQSSVPFKDFEAILKEILTALKAVKAKSEDGNSSTGSSASEPAEPAGSKAGNGEGQDPGVPNSS